MTDFTRTSPTSLGLIPSGFTEVGGIVLDLVGVNGTRVTSQLAASSLFEGFFSDGTPVEFRGNPGTIGIQSGFSQSAIDALGGGLAEVAVRITLEDGDTAAGDFDVNDNTLLLNGIDFGNFSEVETQVTSPDGTSASQIEFGFGNNSLNTGWFFSTDPTSLEGFFQSLAGGQVSFQLSDVDPNDNFFDFTQGIDGGLIDVGSGPNVAPVALDDAVAVNEGTSVSGNLLADNGNGPDGDADNDPLTVTAVNGEAANVGAVITLASGAEIRVQANGDFTLTAPQDEDLAEGEESSETLTYTLSDGNLQAEATVTVTTRGVSAPVDFEISLPESLGAGEVGAAELSHRGTGGAGSAPGVTQLFAVGAERGLVADPLTGSFSDTSFLLAKTNADGNFNTIDVSVKGTAGPRSTLGATAQLADQGAESEIAERISALQPAFVDQDVVARIGDNLLAQFGETIGSLTASLGAHADRFASLGISAESATAALSFAIEAAGDYGSLAERGTSGSLGQGWSALADLGLDIDSPSVQLRGLADVEALQGLSLDSSALYTVSNSVGRAVSLSGDVLALAAPPRPQFEQEVDGSFRTIGLFDGTLIQSDVGFEVRTSDGETLFFDQDGSFQRMELPDGLAVTADHDAEMRITGLTGPNGASLTFARDGDGLLQSVEDADGRIASFAYNADGQLAGVTRPEGESAFTYNNQGDLDSATAPGSITGAFQYDALGRLESADYGGVQSETIAYDTAGGLTITDGAGRVTELDLLPGSVVGRITDGLGNASEILYDEAGSIQGVRGPDGTETAFEFDEQGRLTKITDANGAELGFAYDGAGEEPAGFTDAGGNTRAFDYDSGGRIAEATWPDGTSLQFQYDSQGNLTGYANRRGDEVTYTYDARGRLLSESDSSAGPTSYSYDARGRLTSATDDQGTTTLSYDNADRVTQIDYPTGRSLFYGYNEAGLRASLSDGEDYNLFYDYDALGRLTGLRDEDGQVVAYVYDAAGNLLREENGNGTLSLFTYDEAGRLTRIENQAPDGSINSFNAYGYDAAGQRVSNETQDGTWTYGYDAIGQLTSADFASTNPDIDDKSLVYDYDAAGNRTRVVEDGVETLYTANALNQYTQVGDATFTYDADGNMTSRSDSLGTTTYVYDLDNRLTAVSEADGTVLEFTYDVFGNRIAKSVDGDETEYLVDPFGLGDVVSEFTGGTLAASYKHGLGLVAGEIGSVDAHYDADGIGSVATITAGDGRVQNSYLFAPFGKELLEIESLENSFEFNGILGVLEDENEDLFMRERTYSTDIGRFKSEDPLFLLGDFENSYRFADNYPIILSDPSGEVSIPFVFLTAAAIFTAVSTSSSVRSILNDAFEPVNKALRGEDVSRESID